MKKFKPFALISNILYLVILTIVSAFVLVLFLKPSMEHKGIDEYERAKFIDMVEGSAYKPFVYRALLPASVRVLTALAPQDLRLSLVKHVEQSEALSHLFAVFYWEPRWAFQYLVAALLMLVSLMGFGHYAARLALFTGKLRDRLGTRTLLAMLVLLGLIPCFKYASYIYDPPQLFLFTLALYFLAADRIPAFVITFILCTINKETALLLIPIYAWAYRSQFPSRRYLGTLALLSVIFIAIKAALSLMFRSNPGSFVEFHLLDHNLPWLMEQASYKHLVIFLILLFLVLYKLKEKPEFLRIAFLCTFPPLLILTIFLGYMDEWRDYFEAYPVAFAMIIDSLRRLKTALVATITRG